MRQVICYRPGPRFPSISITGPSCGLGCPHCSGRPLAAMLPAVTPEKLCETAGRLAAGGALGFLLSGGCAADGVLHLEKYLDAIRSIKSTTDLMINAHTGFLRRSDAAMIAASGIDSFSVTYPMSDRIGTQSLLVDDAMARYRETSAALSDAGAKVIPHALLGLGDPQDDIRGLELLAEDPPRSLVVIAFTPLRGTPFGNRQATPESHIIEATELARGLMPGARLVLGCMRPKGKSVMEGRLMRNVLDGIAMPSSSAVHSIAGEVSLQIVEGCCAVHL